MKHRIRYALAFFAATFWLGASATPISISQTLTFAEIQAREFLVGTEGTFDFGLELASIDLIRFTFATLDPAFNSGLGPNGGDAGVEIAVLAAGQTPERFGIASVVTGNQVVTLFPGSGDPLQRFEIVTEELLDGLLTVSLGSWEDFDTFSQGFPLLQPSHLTLEVSGTTVSVPEPTTAALLLVGLSGIVVARRMPGRVQRPTRK